MLGTAQLNQEVSLGKQTGRRWHRLPREAGDAPSLEKFKARLDGALSCLIELKMSLLTAGMLDWVAFKGPSQPKLFHVPAKHGARRGQLK